MHYQTVFKDKAGVNVGVELGVGAEVSVGTLGVGV